VNIVEMAAALRPFETIADAIKAPTPKNVP
jgi:hypothetical protein